VNKAVTIHLLLELFFEVNIFQIEQMTTVQEKNDLKVSTNNISGTFVSSQEIQDTIREI